VKNLYTQGKYPVQIQARDFEIFKFIQSAGPATGKTILSRFWPERSESAGAGKHRLRKFLDVGLLQRWGCMLHLTAEGKQLLATSEMRPESQK